MASIFRVHLQAQAAAWPGHSGASQWSAVLHKYKSISYEISAAFAKKRASLWTEVGARARMWIKLASAGLVWSGRWRKVAAKFRPVNNIWRDESINGVVPVLKEAKQIAGC